MRQPVLKRVAHGVPPPRPQPGVCLLMQFPKLVADLVRRAGFEPATRCLEGSRSIRLSYRRMMTIVHGKGHASATRRSQSARTTQRSIYLTPGWLRSVTRSIRYVPDSLAAATAPR